MNKVKKVIFYECPVCGKSSSDRKEIERHYKTHTIRAKEVCYCGICGEGWYSNAWGEVTGAVKHEGFQFEKNGMKFYVYQNREGTIYIIDPPTGLSLTSEPFSVEDAPSCISEYRIEQMEERRKSEEYQIKVKMFKALKKAAKVKEECEILLKGIKDNGKN